MYFQNLHQSYDFLKEKNIIPASFGVPIFPRYMFTSVIRKLIKRSNQTSNTLEMLIKKRNKVLKHLVGLNIHHVNLALGK